MSGIPIPPRAVADLAMRHGGTIRHGASGGVRRIRPIARAGVGELAPVLAPRWLDEAAAAVARGAVLLLDESLATSREDIAALPAWVHPNATWAMAELLDYADMPADDAIIGPDCNIGKGAVILPRVRLGARVTVGPGAVIGAPGFGFATNAEGRTRHVPQLGGVVIGDDVHIGALATIDSGTLGPTLIGDRVKLDAQVHVGHNCEIGDDTIIAAQSGLAGSVVIGRGVLVGGQVGIADHVTIGDGARLAAKSGVIGDVPAGATFAGYPAVDRHRWLRALAELYRLAAQRASNPPSQPEPR